MTYLSTFFFGMLIFPLLVMLTIRKQNYFTKNNQEIKHKRSKYGLEEPWVQMGRQIPFSRKTLLNCISRSRALTSSFQDQSFFSQNYFTKNNQEIKHKRSKYWLEEPWAQMGIQIPFSRKTLLNYISRSRALTSSFQEQSVFSWNVPR
jgi:lysophospholipid acyltransferase (LPLAT)-like uncharacterized protein